MKGGWVRREEDWMDLRGRFLQDEGYLLRRWLRHREGLLRYLDRYWLCDADGSVLLLPATQHDARYARRHS